MTWQLGKIFFSSVFVFGLKVATMVSLFVVKYEIKKAPLSNWFVQINELSLKSLNKFLTWIFFNWLKLIELPNWLNLKMPSKFLLTRSRLASNSINFLLNMKLLAKANPFSSFDFKICATLFDFSISKSVTWNPLR